jgi:DNA-binding NtrC family response regulator
MEAPVSGALPELLETHRLELERAIRLVLEASCWRLQTTAKALGISRHSLQRRLAASHPDLWAEYRTHARRGRPKHATVA